MFRKVVFAVHWSSFSRLERNFTFFSALRTNSFVHFSWTSIKATSFVIESSFEWHLNSPYIRNLLIYSLNSYVLMPNSYFFFSNSNSDFLPAILPNTILLPVAPSILCLFFSNHSSSGKYNSILSFISRFSFFLAS